MSIKLQGSSHILEQLAKTKQTPWFFWQEVFLFVWLSLLLSTLLLLKILRDKNVKLGGGIGGGERL